jgi:hypothetical protein
LFIRKYASSRLHFFLFAGFAFASKIPGRICPRAVSGGFKNKCLERFVLKSLWFVILLILGTQFLILLVNKPVKWPLDAKLSCWKLCFCFPIIYLFFVIFLISSLYFCRRCCPQRFEFEGWRTKFTKTSSHCQSWFCWYYYIKELMLSPTASWLNS